LRNRQPVLPLPCRGGAGLLPWASGLFRQARHDRLQAPPRTRHISPAVAPADPLPAMAL